MLYGQLHWKMLGKILQLLREEDSLDLMVRIYQLLNEFKKRYPRVYLSRVEKSGSSSPDVVSELVLDEKVWLPFSGLDVGEEANKKSVVLIDPFDFHSLVKDITEMNDKKNCLTPSTKAAKESSYDKEAVTKFFYALVRRRYFPDELPGVAISPWSSSSTQVNRPLHQSSDEILSDEDRLYKTKNFMADPYNRYNTLPPLPAQRNLTPPPTLYPQQPMSTPNSYYIPKFALTTSPEYNSARLKRTDINV